MEQENFKFLDASEKRHWDVLKRAGITFRVSTSTYDRHRKAVVETPDIHHYEFDKFYDAWEPYYGKGCFDSMPNLSIKLAAGSGQQSYHMDTLEKLADLEEKGERLEQELSEVGEKIAIFYADANKTVNEAQNVTCDWNVLAGLKCQTHIDVLKQITTRFDEKLAAFRFQMSENRVQGILNELEDKYLEASKYAKKVLEEIRKFA